MAYIVMAYIVMVFIVFAPASLDPCVWLLGWEMSRLCCLGGHIAQVAILPRGAYCPGYIAQGAILHRWPYCTGGRIVQVAVLHRWPYCTGDCIAQVTVLHRWPHFTGGRITQEAVLHSWPSCTGGRIAQSRVSAYRLVRGVSQPWLHVRLCTSRSTLLPYMAPHMALAHISSKLPHARAPSSSTALHCFFLSLANPPSVLGRGVFFPMPPSDSIL